MAQSEVSKRKLLTMAGVGWLFDAMDVGILSFVMAAIATDWGLSKTEVGWIGSINSVGMAVGALLFGVMADKIGRKHVFIITLLLFSIGSGLSALTSTLTVFLLLRFLIGMGLGGELPVASALVAESVEAKERGRIVVLLESFWAAGWLIAALISYFVIPSYGWRIALVLGALPAFYAIYLRLSLPDSPLFQKNKKKASFVDNVKTMLNKEFRKRTIMLWILWFTVVFSYYGMFLWLPSVLFLKGFDMVRSFQYVLIMTLAQLPGYFTAAWFIERKGRKFVLVTYLIGTAVSAIAFGFSNTVPTLLLSGVFLSFFNLGAWGGLYAYTPEQYPTSFRTTGSGTAASVGRIGGILGPLLVGYLAAGETSFSVIFSIFCVTILVGAAAVALLGTETRQQELQ
ncbi:MFS transporter [Bacillus sp. HMF5848]|uniref:MFS transporter n=1 Tax=Bacillus sp. HMF5848 TaxID=2495421 RepID=UPI000F785A8F|nr:MFS transporter [Bacillus sp. HMF5848]RSK29012.1 MFS transporter [Bacillus sp. HMF5848]